MRIRTLAIGLAALAAAAACSRAVMTRVPAGIEPVTGFEAQRYMGRWHEIARLDHRFERGMTEVTADYSLNDDGTVMRGLAAAVAEAKRNGELPERLDEQRFLLAISMMADGFLCRRGVDPFFDSALAGKALFAAMRALAQDRVAAQLMGVDVASFGDAHATTEGALSVTQAYSDDDAQLSDERLLVLAGAVESASEHAVGSAIVAAVDETDPQPRLQLRQRARQGGLPDPQAPRGRRDRTAVHHFDERPQVPDLDVHGTAA